MKTNLKIWKNTDIFKMLDMSNVGIDYWFGWHEPKLVEITGEKQLRQKWLAIDAERKLIWN